MVVLVDDAHWADLPSVQFPGFLARRLDSARALVIIAIRPAEPGADDVIDDILAAEELTLLRPGNLSGVAAAELVGGDAHDEFCAACHAVTAGNPLSVRELLRVPAAVNVRPEAGNAASVADSGPDAIRWYVAGRVRRRTPEVQAVARAVAVRGDDTPVAVVAEQAGLPGAGTLAAAQKLTRLWTFERAGPC